jgi:hypothetical protein
VFDCLPSAAFDRVRNLNDFAGMRALDNWTCNTNRRQAVFWKKTRDKKCTATFIDQGYCFNAGDWDFPHSPLRGVYPRNEVYAGVSGWESFAPEFSWLSRIENFDPRVFWEIAESVPPQWYGSSLTEMERLIEQLISRPKAKFAKLIDRLPEIYARAVSELETAVHRSDMRDRTGGGSRSASRAFWRLRSVDSDVRVLSPPEKAIRIFPACRLPAVVPLFFIPALLLG